MTALFGRYELLARLATGGMGEVYLARQHGPQGFEKLLVLKALLPHLSADEEFARMFLDEARISATLNHPNIAQIFDLGEVQGTYYLAMEFVHGEDLRRVVKAARQRGQEGIPVGLMCRIAAEAAAGLHFAHHAVGPDNKPLTIVHRDVSPQNILVTFEGGVKIIDFGVAKAAGRVSHTKTGTLKGKYGYMSPEQVGGKLELDGRSDVFGLGVVLWEVLTGQRLFHKESDTETLAAVAECQVPAPSTANARVPAALDAVVLKALARDRDQRYPSAQELRLALEEHLAREHPLSTGAHLAAYMEELFQERLAKERTEGLAAAVISSGGAQGGGFVGRSTTPTRAERKVHIYPEGEASGDDQKTQRTFFARRAAIPAAVVAALLAAGTAALLLRRPAPPSAKALLTVVTDPPGAVVRLDGRLLGIAPLADLPLDATGAESQIVLSRAGHEPATRPVVLTPGRHHIELALVPTPPREVTLRLESEPPGATVSAQGRELGRTPLELVLARSDLAVEVIFALAGYRLSAQSVVPLQDGTVRATLERAPPLKAKTGKNLDIKTGR